LRTYAQAAETLQNQNAASSYQIEKGSS